LTLIILIKKDNLKGELVFKIKIHSEDYCFSLKIIHFLFIFPPYLRFDFFVGNLLLSYFAIGCLGQAIYAKSWFFATSHL